MPVTEFPLEHWVVLTNSVDFQHLRVLHGLKITFDPDDVRIVDHGLEYEVQFESPEFGAFDQKIRVFGTNTICLRGTMGGQKMLTMYTGTPRPNGYTRGWVVSAAPRPREETPEAIEFCDQQVAMTEAFFVGLIEQDTPVMSNIRFREGALVPADRALARFLKSCVATRRPTSWPSRSGPSECEKRRARWKRGSPTCFRRGASDRWR